MNIKTPRLGGPTVGLALLITSYFYSLPLGRFSFLGIGSDFRIYDFVFIAFIFIFGLNSLKRVGELRKDHRDYHYWIMILLILVWLSLGLTAIFGKTPTTFFSATLRAFRFTAYLLASSFIVVIADTPKRQQFLLRVFYLNIVIQAGLAFAQGLGWFGNFWPEYWLVGYGDDFPVGTLSPHHLQIAVVMMLGLGLAMFYFRQSGNILSKLTHAGLAGIMLAVIFFSGTRTVWFSIPIMALAYILIHRARGFLVFVIFSVITSTAIWLGWDYIRDPIQLQLETRVINEVQAGGFSEILSDRAQIYQGDFWQRLYERPWVLIVGTGFQNVAFFLGATGAHNNFLQAWFELGLIGLLVYLRFLKSILNSLRVLAADARNVFEQNLAKNSWAVFIGIFATMMAGETLWAQYSTFALTGQIMALIGLATCSKNWCPNIPPKTPDILRRRFIRARK